MKTHRIPTGTMAAMNFETETTATPAVSFSTNFLTHLMDAPSDTETRVEVIKISCNALTNSVMWSLVKHINAQKRASESGSTLDERNEQDEATRGEAIKAYLTDASGHEPRVNDAEEANICDGIRNSLYDQLHECRDVPNGSIALYEGSTDPAYAYSLPMSLKGLLDFWSDIRGQLSTDDKSRLDIVKSRFPDQYRTAVADAQAKAKAAASKWSETAKDVLAEANSFNTGHTVDDFVALSIGAQLSIAERIHDKLLAKSAKLLTNRMMSVEDAISASTALHAVAMQAKDWLNQPKILTVRGVLADAKQAQQRAYARGNGVAKVNSTATAADLLDDLV
jgi:hypothetical protein